jgi:class 3 adenylate cyclase
MISVRDWLHELGLGQYADAFDENAIEAAQLPDLDHQVLQAMGVNAAGHRMKILKAALDLESRSSSTDVEGYGQSLSTTTPSGGAERRQLTVMFCDLVGSTSLSESMDPEDYRQILARYQDSVRRVVAKYGGYIARYMGDGLLVYFGYPQAHEDDAERSVRTGLEVIADVSQLDDSVGVRLRVRIGIATGLVVAGDIVGEGASEERAVLGDTPNLAARLEALAEPDTILVSDDTHRLCKGFFEWSPGESREVKGFSERFDCWSPRRVLEVDDRFDARHGESLAPFSGRRTELAVLRESWNEAKRGEGRGVLISGEPGMGKSRLVQHFRDQISSEDFTHLRYHTAPFYTSTTLYPVIQQLRTVAGFAPEDDDEARIGKLETMLQATGPSVEEGLPLLADLLGLTAPEGTNALDLAPEDRKRRTLRLLESQLHQLTMQRPLLCVFEDAHWSDPTTIEMLDGALGGVAKAPILFVITYRPEFETRWGETFGHARTLNLAPLGGQDVAALVRGVSIGSLDDDVVARVASQADGIPLYAEELTRGLLETANKVIRGAQIPPTLQASLLSRLDNLGPLKELAQVCSVIGREFDADLAAQVVGAESVLEQLQGLVERRLVYREGDSTYLFKHALIQEAAYASLLNARRRGLHERIAGILASARERFDARPELVAHHYSEADDPLESVPFWRQAAADAVHRAANREAVGHLEKGLGALGRTEPSEERRRAELDLMLMLGPAQMAVRGYASQEGESTFARAHELARELGEPEQQFTALWNQYYIGEMRGQWNAASGQCRELLAIAERLGAPGAMLQAHHAAMSASHCNGQIDTSLEHVRALVSLYDEHEHASHKYQYGAHDPGVCALNQEGLLLTLTGLPEQALESLRKADALADRIGHLPSKAHVLLWTAQTYQYRYEPAKTLDASLRTIEYCQEHGIAPILRMAEYLKDWSSGEDEGYQRLRARMDAMKERKRRGYLIPYFAGLSADLSLQRGEFAAGLDAIDYGLESVEVQGEREVEADLYRLRGELLVCSGDQHGGFEALENSLSVARAQNARLFELRAACSQYRLGQKESAFHRLREVYDSFVEGFDLPDLVTAKGLLGR